MYRVTPATSEGDTGEAPICQKGELSFVNILAEWKCLWYPEGEITKIKSSWMIKNRL